MKIRGFLLIISLSIFVSCGLHKNKAQNSTESITYIDNTKHNTISFLVHLNKGVSFNHPTYAVWIEHMNGDFIHTIFVTRSYATGKYAHAHVEGYQWDADSGISIRPASLPYWKHKATKTFQGNSVIDAISGATPPGSAVISAHTPNTAQKFRVLVEVNQSWDSNNYWTNNKYPDNFEYKTSCQPSLVYAATVDVNSKLDTVYLNPIGHGHYAGENGELYTDLRTFTTALNIFESIYVQLTKEKK